MRAELIAQALGGRRVGGSWMARCPAHEDREPSLAIRDGDGVALVHCHAGCGQRDVLAALEARGLWYSTSRPKIRHPKTTRAENHEGGGDRRKRSERAIALWGDTKPASDTVVERYLGSRGFTLPSPERLRFHPGLKHPAGGTWPAMVALVTNGVDDAPMAVHRTFIAHDGRGKAQVTPQRMMLGPCRGGAVRLGSVDDLLLVGEGIESCLAAMQATGRVAWAALSTSGLKSLHLPGQISQVVVLADGDAPGEAAACDVARRWQRAGRHVRIARPPSGMDFNDLLVADAATRPGGTP